MTKKTAQKKGQRQKRRESKQREQRLRWIRFGGLIILAVGALGIFGFYRVSSAPDVDAPLEIMASNVIGPADNSVRILEFGDFGCPACRQWHNAGIKDRLIDTFGDQISFTFRHFPVITRQSPKAAEAGQCASEQGLFWEYHDFIYEQTPFEALSVNELKNYAAAISLDREQFDQCLDTGKYQSYVARDYSAALAAGAKGTPTFYINGQVVDFFFDSMAAKIQDELES